MKIAVIGAGGAGLTTAWLLEPQHNVTLYERLNRLGGHAATIEVAQDGTLHPIDAGFEWFCEDAFPLFTRLLRELEVAVHSFPMRVTLERPATGHITLFPPTQAGKLLWSALTPRTLRELLQLRSVLVQAGPLVQAGDPFMTLEQFLERLRLRRRFCEDFLYPFLQSGWCLPLDEFLRCSAYDVLKLPAMQQIGGLSGTTWQEVVGGTQVYIRALTQALSSTQVRRATPVCRLTREADHLLVWDEHGHWEAFDQVVLATNAADASRLLTTLEGGEVLAERLGQVEYFETKIAVHGDTRWMPAQRRHWSLVNVRAGTPSSALTFWKPWRGDNLFRSWVTYAPDLPDPLYALETFFHPKPNRSYFEAQAYLATVQGHNRLWLAGMYTQDVDLHESAIRSAVHIAQRLAPDTPRLHQLLGRAAGA